MRVANSNLKLSKSNGFRLVYLVSLITDEVFLLTVFPKRGTKGISNIPNAEYVRLLNELFQETSSKLLHQVDITKGLNACQGTGPWHALPHTPVTIMA